MSNLSHKNKLKVFWELSKPDITLLVIITSVFGYYAGIVSSNGILKLNWFDIFYLVLGVAFSSSGVSTLNGYLESNLDSKMKRTENRPIPSGRISSVNALIYGLAVSAIGVMVLYFLISPLAGLLSILTLALYLLIYTPLKQKTELNTLIGAVPGALPPLGGWVAATGEINIGAWILFGLLFAWQIPHFLAIAWIYKTDYKNAGYKMITTSDDFDLKLKYYIGIFSVLVIIFSVLPSFLGLGGLVYFSGAFIIGFYLIKSSYDMMFKQNYKNAKKLLFATIVYYPILLIIFVLDQLVKINI